jgi:hypothetical protein
MPAKPMNTNDAKTQPARSYGKLEVPDFEFFKFDMDGKNIFEGKFLRIKSGEKDGKKWQSPVFLHADGKEYGLPAHTQILRAVNHAGVGYYRIEYLRDEAVGDGKTQSVYDIQYSKH